jgi:hypothetical protein
MKYSGVFTYRHKHQKCVTVSYTILIRHENKSSDKLQEEENDIDLHLYTAGFLNHRLSPIDQRLTAVNGGLDPAKSKVAISGFRIASIVCELRFHLSMQTAVLLF